MGVMLASQNPEAAAAIGDVSLPGPGAWVVFKHRPGSVRAGMTEVPALVLKRDQNNRHLTLILHYAVDDQIVKERVVRAAGSDEGWEFVDQGRDVNGLFAQASADIDEGIGSLVEGLAAFKNELAATLFGEDGVKPEIPLYELMVQLDQRIAALEKPKGKRQG